MKTVRTPVVALDIGGTHVTAALVDTGGRAVIDGTRRDRPLDPDGSAAEILGTIVDCAGETMALAPAVNGTIGVAIPGPFDYQAGIGRFAGVAKFEALSGVDIGAAMLDRLAPRITRIRFLNDADAFAIGEWTAGAAYGHDRVVAITIGSGIGSTFLDRGHVIEDGSLVPPTGRVYLLTIDGKQLEDRVSRRAIIRAAAQHPVLLSTKQADVRELAEVARAGDPIAAAIFDDVFSALGRALGPWLARFEATVLVVGGSIARSWDLVEPPLIAGLAAGELPWHGPVERPRLGDSAGLIGAAIATVDAASGPPHGPLGAQATGTRSPT